MIDSFSPTRGRSGRGKESQSMWLLVLVAGLSAIGAAVLYWFVHARRAAKAEEQRRWREHQAWQATAKRDEP
jgi:membrane protein YqaA with SNARE-associated domain